MAPRVYDYDWSGEINVPCTYCNEPLELKGYNWKVDVVQDIVFLCTNGLVEWQNQRPFSTSNHVFVGAGCMSCFINSFQMEASSWAGQIAS